MIMGEENTFAGVGTTCFFCKREDIGTDREKWHEAKLDSFKVRDAMEVPELDMEKIMGETPPEGRKGFSTTFTFSLEPSEETKINLIRFHRKIKKVQRGSRYYRRKLLKLLTKKELRHLIHIVRRYNLPSDIV